MAVVVVNWCPMVAGYIEFKRVVRLRELECDAGDYCVRRGARERKREPTKRREKRFSVSGGRKKADTIRERWKINGFFEESQGRKRGS
jgi:hypothetical protein